VEAVIAPPGHRRELAERALVLSESAPDEAERLAREALAAIADGGDAETSSLAQQALGMVAWERQAIGDSVAYLRAAVAIGVDGGHPVVAARARSRLAVVLSYAGDDSGALAEAAAAAPLLAGGQRAELHHHMAGILERQGRLRDAFELATRALQAFRRLGDRVWQAKALNNRGIILAQLGQVAAAARQFTAAERLYTELEMPLGALKVRNNRAWLASLNGDISLALQLHDGLQAELAELGVPPGLFRLDHASVLLAASLPTEALQVAENAAADLAAESMDLDRAEALLLASRAARMCGAYDRAEALAGEAAAAFERQRRTAWLLRARHALIEVAWTTGRHDASTEALAAELAEQLGAAGWRDWSSQLHLLAGRMALARRDVEQAEARLGHIRAAAARGAADASGFAVLRARLLRERGDTVGARRVIHRALSRLEERESLVGATELRFRSAQYAAELADLGLEWAIATARPSVILRWAERRRAVGLRIPPVRPPHERELADLLAERRVLSAALEQLERDADLDRGPDRATLRRVAALEARIRATTRAVRGPGGRARYAFSVAALADALGERALVELVADRDALGAVTVVGGRIQFQVVGSLAAVQQELGYTRSALRRALLGRSRSGHDPLAASLTRLDELVGVAIARVLGDREAVLVPLASLHTLPWWSLPSLRGRPVTVAPSATMWRTAVTADRAADRVGGRARRVVVVAGPNLAHAAEEAAVVRRIARTGRVLSGDAATAAAVLRAVDGATVAHFACHGRFHPENPLFSSLQMVDGPLTVYELERLRKAPELVLLSACDSAVSATGAGEELMGLTATLLALGCRTLIGAVAPISDVAAQPLMAGVHAALAAGRPPAMALAEARRSIDPADRAAFATGVAFGCFGAGS
jgi:hypothetical protein